MNDEITNPDAPSPKNIFKAITDLRAENTTDHQNMIERIACLETKWGTFWRLVKWLVAPVMGGAIGAAAVVSLLLRGGGS